MNTVASPTPTPKILVSFSLTRQSRAKLQKFFDANFKFFLLSDPGMPEKRAAREVLQRTIEETFPPQALEELRRILHNQSDYVLLIRNCPEHKVGFEKVPKDTFIDPDQTYGEHIAQALYDMSGAEHFQTVPVRRPTNAPDFVGGHIHRDSLSRHKGNKNPPFGEYVIFYSTYNEEHALTQAINMRSAIESIPEEMRDRIEVVIKGREGTPRSIVTLSKALQQLQEQPVNSKEFVTQVSPLNPDTPESKEFLKAVAKHSITVDLQPGDLLVLNENTMFHHAHRGDLIHRIPPEQPFSRVLFHSAGGPAPRGR